MEIKNDKTKAGKLATQKEIFGDGNRYAVYAVHTRFDAVEWMVADAEVYDYENGNQATVIRQAATKEEAVKGLI